MTREEALEQEPDDKYEVWYVCDTLSGLVAYGHTKMEAYSNLERKLKDRFKCLLKEIEKEENNGKE